jgi:ABC-type transport system involved in cytochrome c biogenesis permease subunit
MGGFLLLSGSYIYMSTLALNYSDSRILTISKVGLLMAILGFVIMLADYLKSINQAINNYYRK